jgi:hypothetical protein
VREEKAPPVELHPSFRARLFCKGWDRGVFLVFIAVSLVLATPAQ